MKRTSPAIGLMFIAILVISCSVISPARPTPRPATATPSPIATEIAASSPTPTAGSSAQATVIPTIAPLASPTVLPASSGRGEVTPAGILAKVTTSRGLAVKGEVPFATLSRAELRPYLVKSFEKDNGKEELDKTKTLWITLDLIEEKDDLYELWLGLLGEQVVGFYELDNHSMKLIGGGGALSMADELTLAHEYVHALQDQQFDIGARVKQAKHDGEKSLALKALLEGDATLAMADYASKNMSKEALTSLQNDTSSLDMQELRSAPIVLQAELLFPYQQGTNFVASLFRSGGWAAVNKAYANPPTTSEQIIHPEKYVAGEGPQRVELPDVASALGPQWSAIDDGTIGELGWLVYLVNGLDAEEAASGAVGWGGDRYALFRSSSGKPALVVLSVWDTADDADEFFYALYDRQDAEAATKFTLDEETQFAWTRTSASGYASIKDRHVLLVITPDEATTKRVVGRLSGF